MYLTYSEYLALGGDTSIFTQYEQLEFDAETIINYYTFNRLVKPDQVISKNVKLLTFKLIQLSLLKQQLLPSGKDASRKSSGIISSQSNDGLSTTFNVLSASEMLTVSDKERKLLVQQYLSNEKDMLGHRLLYRGLYPDE